MMAADMSQWLAVGVDARETKVDAKPIRELSGVLDRFRAQHGIVVTTGFFTERARTETESNYFRVSLRDYDYVRSQLNRLYGPPLLSVP
jgi:restriction endonuclease Mrr